MRRRHHLDAALRSFSPAKKAGVSAEAPSLLLLSPAPLSSSLPVSISAISCDDHSSYQRKTMHSQHISCYLAPPADVPPSGEPSISS